MTDRFSVQLDQLDDLGTRRLPGVSTAFDIAGAGVGSVLGETGAMFSMGGPSNLFLDVGVNFERTAGFLRRALGDNTENVNLAAEAIRQIAARYREADGQV